MSATDAHDVLAQKEKQAAAMASVIAAVALTGMKLAAGFATGSLGILSEAAHSALDLAAAGVTYYAVRLSSQPADQKHPYGHGKVENLSALIETILLLATCGWIVYEAVERLLHPTPVDSSLWAVGVMVVSIVVDFTRSRMLLAAAKKHNSQALEADALHFSTDIWSSLVVLAGLFALWMAEVMDPASALAPWLKRADAIAALAVSGIVLSVSMRLGRQAVDVLLDAGVEEAQDAVRRAVLSVPDVLSAPQVRVRQSGPASFVDLVLGVPGGLGLEEAHRVAAAARQAARQALPGAEVLVELKPQRDAAADMLERARTLAEDCGLAVHDLDLRQAGELLLLNLHAEVPASLSLAEAHERVSRMETALRREFGPDFRVATHIEPEGAHPEPGPGDPQALDLYRETIKEAVEEADGVCDMHGLLLEGLGSRPGVSFHCRMHPDTPVTRAHESASRLEAAVRARLPQLSRVTIHMEPEA